jgi:hypothetical protein
MNQTSGTLRSLGRATSLRLHRPVTTNITKLGPSEFVARAPELGLLLSATGKSPSAAARRLAAGIALQYGVLVATPRASREILHRKMLRSLRRFVKESASTNEPIPARQAASRKTRVRKKS